MREPEAKQGIMSKRDALWSVLSGLMICLSFPRISFSALAFFSLVPLLHALEGKSPRDGFTAGALTGLTANIGLLYWVVFVVVTYGSLSVYAGVAAMLALAAFLSIYTGIFAVSLVYFRRRAIPDIISAPLLWTVIEYGKSHLMTGFPWENLAYSQYLNIYIIQMADVTGPYGVTFFIVFINVIVHDAWKIRDIRNRLLQKEVAAGILMTAVVGCYGFYRTGAVETSFEGRPSREVLIVQGNIDQSIKWNPAYQRETLEIYRNLSLKQTKSRSDLIVWPETAVPFYFQDVNDFHRDVIDVAVRSGSHLLFGSPSYVPAVSVRDFQNSAFLVSPLGRVVGKYDKVHLVPFGEYVPLRSVLPVLGQLADCVGDCLPGTSVKALQMDDVRVGVLICYEGIFPEISREYVLGGAGVLVNITNDAWFGRTSAPYQHMSMVTFRSVENRVYTVRAANTGISTVIDPLGRITASTDLFERTTLGGKIKLGAERTFYTAYGDVFAYGCMGLLALLALITLRRR